jgi:hypothetical protein
MHSVSVGAATRAAAGGGGQWQAVCGLGLGRWTVVCGEVWSDGMAAGECQAKPIKLANLRSKHKRVPSKE